MSHNMLKALPGVLTFGGMTVWFVVQGHAIWGIMATLCYFYSTIEVGANADYWEKRYRTRNWGKGDHRFTPGNVELD